MIITMITKLASKLKKLWVDSIQSVGIDVSKKKLDICFQTSDKQDFYTITNNRNWIEKFIDTLTSLSFSISFPIVVESTWDYHLLLCLSLKNSNYSIREINPITTKQYNMSSIRWSKTDKTDCEVLAKIGRIDWSKLRVFDRSLYFIETSKKITLVATIENKIQWLKATIENFKDCGKELWFDVSDKVKQIEWAIAKLESTIKELEKEIEKVELENKQDEKNVDIIDSVSWISTYMATVFYVRSMNRDFNSKDELYAFLWFDPKLKQSWTSVHSCSRISKRWDSYLRKKLYQAAFCWKKFCPYFEDIYQSAKTRWKHHFEAIIMVVKKIVHIIRSMLKYQTYFDKDYFAKSQL